MENITIIDQVAAEPKISVIIPIHNTEIYLEECLESCSKQTLPEVEFILINDGSTDGSQKIIDRFAQKDTRFISIYQENRGVSRARNTGLDRARGKMLMFLDSDDFLEPCACETVWNEYLSNDPDIIIFKTNIYTDDPEVITPWLKRTLTNITRKKYEAFTPDVLFKEPAAKPFIGRDAFRKGFIDLHRLRFNEELKLAEDLVFQMDAFPHASRISFIPDELYNYRRGRSGSATEEITDLKEKLPQHLTAVRHITDYWDKNGWLELYWEQYVPWAYNFVMQEITREEPCTAREHLRKIFEITHLYHLEQYIEKLSPSVFESFMNIAETIEGHALSEEEQLKTLDFQMKIIRLQTRNEQSRSRNERLAVQLKQTKEKNASITKQLEQVKLEKTDLKKYADKLNKTNSELQNRNNELKNSNTQLKKDIKQISNELNQEKKIHEKTAQELKSVYLSHAWKIGNLMVHPLHRIREVVNKVLKTN